MVATDDISAIVAEVVFNIRVSRYTLVAGATVWAYDLLLTLDDELSLLWARGGLLIKVLYLMVSINVTFTIITVAELYTEPLYSTPHTLHLSYPSVQGTLSAFEC